MTDYWNRAMTGQSSLHTEILALLEEVSILEAKIKGRSSYLCNIVHVYVILLFLICLLSFLHLL